MCPDLKLILFSINVLIMALITQNTKFILAFYPDHWLKKKVSFPLNT